jgi:hypothetical protein
MEKEALREKLKGLSVEEKRLFLQTLQEDLPEETLSLSEVSAIREMLAEVAAAKDKINQKSKGKKGSGILAFLDSLTD